MHCLPDRNFIIFERTMRKRGTVIRRGNITLMDYSFSFRLISACGLKLRVSVGTYWFSSVLHIIKLSVIGFNANITTILVISSKA